MTLRKTASEWAGCYLSGLGNMNPCPAPSIGEGSKWRRRGKALLKAGSPGSLWKNLLCRILVCVPLRPGLGWAEGNNQSPPIPREMSMEATNHRRVSLGPKGRERRDRALIPAPEDSKPKSHSAPTLSSQSELHKAKSLLDSSAAYPQASPHPMNSGMGHQKFGRMAVWTAWNFTWADRRKNLVLGVATDSFPNSGRTHSGMQTDIQTDVQSGMTDIQLWMQRCTPSHINSLLFFQPTP